MPDARRRMTMTAALVAALMAPGGGTAAEHQTIGYIEAVILYPGKIPFTAKIDTGAYTSSINADEITPFERDGRKWVRFSLAGDSGPSVTLERPVVRVADIRRAGTNVERRYVVNLGVCLGRYYKDTEVNLNDRKGMNYQILIGRRFLTDRFLIDASARNLTEPDCPAAAGQ